MQNQPLIEVHSENKIRVAEQLIAQRALYDQQRQVAGKQNLFVFNKHILGIERGKGSVKLSSFHKELCNFVTDDMNRKKLILVPRGHLKSSLITIGYSLFRIINDPNIRILILNATWQMAVDFLTEIKRHLRENEDLVKLYGDLSEGAEEWSADRITLKRSDHNIKGPSVWATGIESNLVGSHPDLIILDDVVNRDNSETSEQITKVIDRYRDTLDLLEPGGQLIVIGTRWTPVDLYGWILDPENNVKDDFDIMVKQAYGGNIETGEEFFPLWSEKFDLAELQSRLRGDGWYQFSAQYMNNPIPEQDAKFKRADFQLFDVEEVRGKEMRKVLTIDPAISTEKHADFTAMTVCGIDQFSNVFLLDIWRGKVLPSQLISKIFELNELWHPNHIGIETTVFQKTLAYSLREEMQRRGRFLPLTEVQPHERTKELRIQGLQPLYESRKVFHPRNHPLKFYFEQELVEFPRGGHDDMIDAFSYALDFLHPVRPKKNRYQRQFLY